MFCKSSRFVFCFFFSSLPETNKSPPKKSILTAGAPFFTGVCEETCSLFTCPVGFKPKPKATLGNSQEGQIWGMVALGVGFCDVLWPGFGCKIEKQIGAEVEVVDFCSGT